MSADSELGKKLQDAIWIAGSLFNRGKTAGSSANLSFRHRDRIYITGSGTCFGALNESAFSELSVAGELIYGVKPSKEYPLHLSFYQKNSAVQAVIHTHSFYSTLWSCWAKETSDYAVPQYTPYLAMKLGSIVSVSYAPPGSNKLFDLFREACVSNRKGYLLKNHGPVVGDEDLFSAFYGLEELEESCRIAWELRGENCEVLP